MFPRTDQGKLSPEYAAERAPHIATFEASSAPFWADRMAGKISHAEYLEAIQPFTKKYVRDITPIWLKHGGI